MRRQHRLDLARLDPEPPDLHLIVGTTQILQRPVGRPPPKIPAPVHPLARLTERARDEPLRRQSRLSRVTAGQPVPGHVDLAGNSHRRRNESISDHEHAKTRECPPDHAPSRDMVRRQLMERDMHRCLGDPEHIDQAWPAVRTPGPPGGQLRRLQRLAAEDHHPQRLVRRPDRRQIRLSGHQLIKRRRSLAQYRDALAVKQAPELLRRPGDVERDHHHPAAGQQCTPQFPHREVERERMKPAPHVIRTKPEQPLRRGKQADHVAMGDRDTLGVSTGAGGVDHVCWMIGQQRTDRVAPARSRRFPLRQLRVEAGIAEQHHRHVHMLGQARNGVGSGQNDHGFGVGQQVGDPVTRICRIDRKVRPARLKHGQKRDHKIDTARQAHRDQRLGAHSRPHQRPGQPIRARVQLRVGQLLTGAYQGNRVRGQGGLRREQLGYRRGGHLGRGVVALHHQPATLPLAEHIQVDERDVRAAVHRGIQCGHHGLDDVVQHPAHRVRIGRGQRVHGQADAVAVVVDRNRQRVVGTRPDVADLDAGQIGAGVLNGGLVVPVVEQRGKEHRVLAGDAACLLGHDQRYVLVGQQVGQLAAQRGQGGKRAGPVHPHPDRQSVDEHALHPVRPSPGVHPADEHGAENDVIAPRHRGQHPRPGQVEDGRPAQAQSPSYVPQPRGQRVVDR